MQADLYYIQQTHKRSWTLAVLLNLHECNILRDVMTGNWIWLLIGKTSNPHPPFHAFMASI